MLISFTVENYRSFAGEQTLSLEAAKDDTHPSHVVNCGKFSLLKTAAIYGANASGKSNLLKAFGFMAGFVRTSATKMTLGDAIRGADCFRLVKAQADQPCSFDIRLLLRDVEYQYGFSVTKQRVHDEWLYITQKGAKSSNPLQRHLDPSTERTAWKLRGELKGANDIVEKTRDNGLFLSRAAEMNVDSVKELFLWFKEHLHCLNFAKPPTDLMEETARRIGGDRAFRTRVESLVRDADFGISGIEATVLLLKLPESGNRLADYIEGPSRLGRVFKFSVQTVHRLPDSEDTVAFSLEDEESNGTQRFFGIIGPVLEALDHGSLLVVDELDCSMHPQLTHKLVEMFHSEEANPKGAQLVFATHDTNLMTPSLFRRDQIWLTEKTSSGGTSLFSLSDIESEKRPRKEEPFEKHYLAGRYGGVPTFGPAFEDLDVR